MSAPYPPARPGMGHNRGPGWSARRYAWGKARRDLVQARVPMEIVRLRVRRAEALGLSYPQYASILLGTGRDIVGFLFTVGGLQLRLARRLEAPAPVRAKLAAARAGTRIALTPADEAPEAFRIELIEAAGAPFEAAAPAPLAGADRTAARRAIRAALDPLKLPGDAVVMVGAAREELDWAEAARLARFLDTGEYFGNGA